MNCNELDQKLIEIALALGEPWQAQGRKLIHPAGDALLVKTDSRLKFRNRLLIEGDYSQNGEDLTDYLTAYRCASLPSIHVTLTREASAIANEIRIRLLPRYREMKAVAKQAKANYDDQRWREKQIAINLRNALGERCTKHEGAKVSREYPRRPDRRLVEVEARVECWHRDAPAMVRVHISGLAPEEAEELLAWTRKINPSAPAEEG